MERKIERSPGGKLALWVFYAFAVTLSGRWPGMFGSSVNTVAAECSSGRDLGSTSGKWLGALLGCLVLGTVGLIPGGIAWYTRPRQDNS